MPAMPLISVDCPAPNAFETFLHSSSGVSVKGPSLSNSAGRDAGNGALPAVSPSASLPAEGRLRRVARADLPDRAEPVLDHGVRDVLLRYADRGEREVRDDAVALGLLGRVAVLGLDADQVELH